MNINDLSTNKDLHHVIGNMENMRYNDARKLDKAKTSHVPGQNPGPDMQVLPYVLVRPYKNAVKAQVSKIDS